jgi:Rha family phage regulatory protein
VAEVVHHLPPALEEYLPPLNDPVVHADGMRVYATTMDIAAFFRKQHKNVLAAVREIELLQPEFFRLNFQPITYLDSHGREQPAFEVTKAGFTVLVGRFHRAGSRLGGAAAQSGPQGRRRCCTDGSSAGGERRRGQQEAAQ